MKGFCASYKMYFGQQFYTTINFQQETFRFLNETKKALQFFAFCLYCAVVVGIEKTQVFKIWNLPINSSVPPKFNCGGLYPRTSSPLMPAPVILVFTAIDCKKNGHYIEMTIKIVLYMFVRNENSSWNAENQLLHFVLIYGVISRYIVDETIR